MKQTDAGAPNATLEAKIGDGVRETGAAEAEDSSAGFAAIKTLPELLDWRVRTTPQAVAYRSFDPEPPGLCDAAVGVVDDGAVDDRRGLLTPTLKNKSNTIQARFAAEIAGLYKR